MLPNTPSTLTFADLYGSTPPGFKRETPAEKDSVEASGDYVTKIDLAKPAVFWVAFVGLLVFVRVLWEKGAK